MSGCADGCCITSARLDTARAHLIALQFASGDILTLGQRATILQDSYAWVTSPYLAYHVADMLEREQGSALGYQHGRLEEYEEVNA